jgi:hypothetical protein
MREGGSEATQNSQIGHGQFSHSQEGNHKVMKNRTSSFQTSSSDHSQGFSKNAGGKKANKRKGKKGHKWDKADSHKELLGFDQHGPSPFDIDSGYDINDLHLIHFKERPLRKKSHKSSNFSTKQHVQANHRFVLKPNRNQDYFFATYDPDYEIDWDDIFLVQAKRHTEYLCPICRDETLVAPVITK